MSRTIARLACIGFVVALVPWGCRDKTPTDMDESTIVAPITSNSAPTDSPIDPTTFSCSDVQEVRVRFSSPGFVRVNDVAVYASFIGAPPGDKFLRIWWDYEGDREEFEIVDTQAGQPQRDNDDLFDIEAIVEHTYEGLPRQKTFTVRVELILEGGTRGCARNRDVTVDPPSSGGQACQAFNLAGFVCPTGATQFCASGPIGRMNQAQARQACVACYGAPCFLETADCAGSAFGPSPGGAFTCGDAYFGFQNGCSGGPGRIWEICNSFNTFGRWAP